MAHLHVLSEWHGPGEEKAARRLAEILPDHWDVVAGRSVPSGMGTVDLDLVVVGEHAVFVCEEKAWGKHVVTGEVSWYVNGSPRHSPANQVAHAARVLAGRLKLNVAGWSQALGRMPRGAKPVFAHIVLSRDHLVGAAAPAWAALAVPIDLAHVLFGGDTSPDPPPRLAGRAVFRTQGWPTELDTDIVWLSGLLQSVLKLSQSAASDAGNGGRGRCSVNR